MTESNEFLWDHIINVQNVSLLMGINDIFNNINDIYSWN